VRWLRRRCSALTTAMAYVREKGATCELSGRMDNRESDRTRIRDFMHKGRPMTDGMKPAEVKGKS